MGGAAPGVAAERAVAPDGLVLRDRRRRRLLLFDPIAPPSENDELAASGETVIVLTAP